MLGVLVGLFALLSAPAASAAPVGNLDNLPPNLQKYVPNSPAWDTSPWMTSPTCQGKGGDFGIWATTVVDDTPSLLEYFQASVFGSNVTGADKARSDAVIAGYQTLAQQVPAMLPSGTSAYCVSDLMQWAGSDPTVKPFGFPWGLDNNHRTEFFCVDLSNPNTEPATEFNKYLGAERAPCTGFYLSCANAPAAQKTQCAAWDTFSDEYVKRVTQLRSQANDDHPGGAGAPVATVPKPPGQIASDIAGGWFTDLTTTIARGSATLLADSMSWWTTTDHTAMLSSPAITQIQGMLRYVGLALLTGSVIWQGIMMIVRRKLDPLVSTGMGLLSFVGWSALGGTAALLINQGGIALADQVLRQSIDGFTNSVSGTLVGLAASQTGAVFFLAIMLFLLACIQWVLGFFRMGALVILLALLPTAAAGQINEKTKPWLPKIASWGLSLELYQPASAVVDATGFTLIGKGGSLSTVLVGMAVITLGVISMPTMLRFFDWGGQQLVNTGGGGGGLAAGAAASALGGGGAAGFGRFMEQNGPAGERGARDSGAMPVSSAHTGDGPGSRPSSGASADSTSGSGSSTPTGIGGGPTRPGHGVSSAASGAGQPTGSSAGAGSAVRGAAGGSAAGGAAAAGPAGTAVIAARDGVNTGVTAVTGAITEDGRSGGAT